MYIGVVANYMYMVIFYSSGELVKTFKNSSERKHGLVYDMSVNYMDILAIASCDEMKVLFYKLHRED